MWQAGTSKVVAPVCVIKDCSVGPHEQVLNVLITCRWYRPGKPSSWSSSRAWLTPPASLAGSGEKLGTDPRIGQPACCGLCWEPFFLGAVESVQIYRRLAKGCHIWGLPTGSVRRAYVDWRGKRMCRVGRVFPCWVYIDSNRRDSRIWVTACLCQSSRS
jgi:hypothetical protein